MHFSIQEIRFLLCCNLIAASFVYGQVIIPPNPADTQAVAAGQITSANAIWWGFDSTNVTSNLQAALYSRATKLRIPNVGQPWIVDPLFLSSNKEITLDSGVVLLARKGSFMGNYDCLLNVFEVHDVSIIGYGAEVRMNQADYTASPYTKAEWRNCLNIIDCSNINVFGLKLVKSGGDGIGIDGNEPKGNHHCSNIHIKDCVCDSNYRNNISVITAQNLLIENCVLSNAHGTAPQGGIDFEPDWENDTLINCTLKNCKIFGNYIGIYVSIQLYNQLSQPILITIDSCVVWNNDICPLDVTCPETLVPYLGYLVLHDNQFIGDQYFYRTIGLHTITINKTTSKLQPSPPSNLEAFIYGVQQSSQVLFQWTPTNGTAIYHFQLSQNPHFGVFSYPLDASISASTVIFGPLDNERAYYYRVQVINDSGVSEYTPVHTFIKSDLKTIPINLELYQNYPNPFNPTTRIFYNLPNAGFATLKIYNSLGQEVSTIVSQYMQPGRHTVEWDATGFASGIYFCVLRSGASKMTKKLALIR